MFKLLCRWFFPPQSGASQSLSKPFRSSPTFYEEDLWIEIAKHLDGKSLVMLAATCHWFKRIMMEECIWKFACLRDLVQVPDPKKVAFKWIKLYAAAFDGSHSFMLRHKEKHIDWMRIGAFFFDSSVTFLTKKLICSSKLLRNMKLEKLLLALGSSVVSNVKNGIWIADLHLVQCSFDDGCDGTMQIVEARHMDLLTNKRYQNGSWEYEQIAFHEIKNDAISGSFYGFQHMNDSLTSESFGPKCWIEELLMPKATDLHAVALKTELKENEVTGLFIRCYVMRAGADGEVVSIRVSQC